MSRGTVASARVRPAGGPPAAGPRPGAATRRQAAAPGASGCGPPPSATGRRPLVHAPQL